MAILVDKNTRVLVQGITGNHGTYHTEKMLEYGTAVVAGVTPGRSGQKVHGVPVYNTVAAAMEQHSITASMIIVPAPMALGAAVEAIDNGIPLIVIITEHIPYHDALIIKNLADAKGVRVVGPNTIGVISPGLSKVGIMPGNIYGTGTIGLISRSGTLTHELASNLHHRGYGLSTCVCIGGDLVKQINFLDLLRLFRDDPQTEKIIMIGEIGGAGEETAAQYVLESKYPKKIMCYIAGLSAPAEKRMGHAGAIVSRGVGSPDSKMQSLSAAGVSISKTMDELLAQAISA